MTEFSNGEQHKLEGSLLESNLQSTHLTPIEHAIIGSSIEVDGKFLNSSEILQRGPSFFLSPLGLNNIGAEQIRKKREAKFLEGMTFQAVIPKDVRSFFRSGHYLRLWLPNLDKDGKSAPRFRIQIIRDNPQTGVSEVIKNKEPMSLIAVPPSFEHFFSLEEERDTQTGETTGDLTLSVKT